MLAVNERKASHHIITAVLVGGTSCVTVHTKFVTVPLSPCGVVELIAAFRVSSGP